MPQPIRELAPGLFHWTAEHPKLGIDVSSYFLAGERVLLDPLEPPDGLDWFGGDHAPEHILLTNRHHLRSSLAFVERFGCSVRASRPGVDEFAPGDPVEPFDYGDRLPGGIVAHEVGAICPDETALELPSVRALACADGVINYGGLGFVPDDLIGDDPPAVKQGLVAAYRSLAEEVEFDHLLLAHGDPVVGDGREALRAFTEREGS